MRKKAISEIGSSSCELNSEGKEWNPPGQQQGDVCISVQEKIKLEVFLEKGKKTKMPPGERQEGSSKRLIQQFFLGKRIVGEERRSFGLPNHSSERRS